MSIHRDIHGYILTVGEGRVSQQKLAHFFCRLPTMAHYPRNLNPFLDEVDDDIASISSAASFFSAATPPNYPPPPPPPRVIQQNIKLPPFWNDAPVAWFVAAEAQFELRHVDSQKERFCHVTTALDKLSLKKIVHLVANPDPIRPYTRLKEALLASHVLTDFQRVELLLAVEPLGGRKPSELLADMWELCPDNQHNSIFFAALFLQRLPREIRVMLTHEDHSDLRRLAAHADRLIAFGGRQDTVACAVELPQDDVVAAIQQKGKQQSRNRDRPQKKSKLPPLPPRPAGGQSGQHQKTDTAPSTVAREATGLCFYHWSFGDKAHSCQAPCSWQGN